MRSFRGGRVLIVLIILGALLQGSAGLAAMSRPAAQVSVHGELQLYTGALPAVWSYDPAQERMLIDIQVQENLRSWVLLDWKSASPMGFIGREDGCFSFPLRGERPSPASFDRLLRAPSKDAGRKSPDELPEGLNSVRKDTADQRYLVLKEPDAILVFKIGSAVKAQNLPDFGKDTSRCQPLSQLTETLTRSQVPQPPATDKADSSSLLQYNHPYTFRGAIYGHLSYKGQVFSQTKPEYDTAFELCKADGPGQCKPFYETGGWFGRYGYHCGDGWGGGHDKKVSGQDYCCYLHDRQVWGGAGKDAENLCGFAACMTCKYYTSLPDWEQNFRGDFWAQKAIAVYVATGIAVVLCHPQNYLTGFTCN